MRKEYLVAGLVAVAALPVGCPFMVAPLLFPDLGRPTLWALFFAGPLISTLLFAGAAFVAMDRDPAAKWRRKASGFKGKVIRRSIAGGMAILAFLVWLFWPLDPLRNQLPGFTAYVVISLQGQPGSRRQYVYAFGPEEASHAEFYLSASGEYTFSVTDLHGEKYPIETNIGDNGIPLRKPIVLFNQVALTDKTTILRLSVNGKEVIRRTMPFVINIPRNAGWLPGKIGADEKGNNGGNFWLLAIAVWAISLPNSSLSAMWANAQKEFKL